VLNMRERLLGYSFKPRPNIRVLLTVGSVMTIGLLINGCQFDERELTRLTSPDVWAAVT